MPSDENVNVQTTELPDGCFEWITEDGGSRKLCCETREAHDHSDHSFVSRAEFAARGASGFGQTRTPTEAARAYTVRDTLVRVDRDCVLNPAAIVAMLEDTISHRDGTATKTTVRTSVFLASRQAPIVCELPLDDVLARIVSARFEAAPVERSQGADAP